MPRHALAVCVLALLASGSLRAQPREVIVYVSHDQEHSQSILEAFEAELELAGEYRPEVHDVEYQRFDWHQFSKAELDLCPPVLE